MKQPMSTSTKKNFNGTTKLIAQAVAIGVLLVSAASWIDSKFSTLQADTLKAARAEFAPVNSNIKLQTSVVRLNTVLAETNRLINKLDLRFCDMSKEFGGRLTSIEKELVRVKEQLKKEPR